ncbi:MAG: N(4)-(beta-N-acetylglucosaminyl)-L-asparaginase [Phycisphaerales bacterium]
MTSLDRRSFLALSAASIPLIGTAATHATETSQGRGGPVVISSGNGVPAVTRAMELLREGADPCEAVVAGVSIVEDDPNDMSVGYGGLPNEHGVVQLDASVMHGPTHKAGAVAAIENIRNPARVALEVLRRTDHVLLVGQGAYEFARALGFPHQDMLTERAREAWLRWKADLSHDDDWLNSDQLIDLDEHKNGNGDDEDGDSLQAMLSRGRIPFTYGTIHCAAVNERGDLGACTTTSGLSYKIPGRVGDSPIVGAGMFVDNEVGAAGATGRGESVIQSCGAFQIVQNMKRGHEPVEACLELLKWIASHTKRHDLLNERGEPNFGCTVYALRKDGVYGSATMRGGGSFAVHDGNEARRLPCAPLFEN